MGKCKKSKENVSSEILASLAAYLSFGKALEDDALLHLIMEIGVEMMRADEGSLLLLDREKKELEFMITIGPSESAKTLKGQRFSMHQGISGLAASTGEPQTGSPSYRGVKQPRHEKEKQLELTAVLAAPMIVEDNVVGVITAVSYQKERVFSSNDAQLYCKFANLCGNVLQHRLREAAVRNILLGDEVSEGAVPEIQRVLASQGLTPSDRSITEIAKNLGQLSSGREDVLPICSALVSNILLLAKDLGWKAK